MTTPVPPDVLARAAAILDSARRDHVIATLLECNEPEVVVRTAIVAVDLEGGNPRRAAAELRRAAADAANL